MSVTYISTFVIVLGQILNWFGITVGTEELTTTVTTLGTILLGLWVMYDRFGKGDITIAGTRKA